MDWMRELEFERRKDRERSSSGKGNNCVQQRVRLAWHKIRRRGGTVPPTSNQPPDYAQGRRLLGPAALRTCPFASLLGQVRACLGPGGYCRCSGNGGPETCLPAACGVAQRGPSMAHLHQHKLKTLARGQASRGGRQGAYSDTASLGGLTRRRRVQGRVPREVPMTQAMTTKGAGRAPVAQCPPFLFGARGASTGESIKQRHPFRCNKTKTSPTAGRKSLWIPRRRHHQSL